MSADESLTLPRDEFDLLRRILAETGLDKPLADMQARIRLRLAEARAEAAEARLAEAGQAITTFLAVRGEHAEAADLAEGLRQILGRDKDGSEERGS